ncbi:MAG: hypothetical protein NT004_11510, partial [Bacteroidetes bacterium]|nr:hypothetical protein [Bacteroidota bacterium]
MKRTLLLLTILFFWAQSSWALVAVTVTNPTNTTPNLAASYTSLANAITALNAITAISGPVTLTCDAGSETAPVGGYSISFTASATAVNNVVISGTATTTIAAFTPQVAGQKYDAIFRIIGCDYVTIQNFTMLENSANTVAAVATNTMTEFGVGLFASSTTNGAQNNTIQNNTITLSSATAYQNAIGIFSTTASSSTNSVQAATSIAGTNSNNKFYGNTISGVAHGLYFISPAQTATVFESGNDIGGTSLTTANTITYGISNTAGDLGFTSYSGTTPAGVFFRNVVGNSVRYNTINSFSGLTLTSGGIFSANGTAPTGITYTTNFSNNTITITNASTTAIAGIEFGSGLAAGTIIANNNTIVLNQNPAATNSAAVKGINAAYASATNTCNSNNVTINQSTTGTGITSGTLTAISVAGTSTTINVLNNVVLVNQTTSSTSAVTSSVNGIVATSAGTTTNIGSAGNPNTVTLKQAVTGSGLYGAGTVNYINAGAAHGTLNIIDNVVNNTGSYHRSNSAAYGISHAGSIVTALTVNNNTVNINAGNATGPSPIYGIYGSASTGAIATYNITNNPITLVAPTSTSISCGIYNADGGAATKTYTGNNITISGAGTTVKGISSTWGQAIAATNTLNLVSSSVVPTIMTGIEIGSSTSTGLHSVTNNTFTNLAFTGIITSSPTLNGITLASGTTANVFSNTITNLTAGAATSSGSPVVSGIIVSAGTSANVYKNKIYGLATLATGATTLVNGILLSGGTTNTVYNNLIGGLTASAATNPDAIRGISVTSTTTFSTNNIYYNTVYLAGGGGANFGSSGLYHTASTTATTATLNLRNNIIVNNTTPNGTGLAVAYRRISGSANMLNNYASTSNNNLFFAGVLGGSANQLIYSDGTSTAQTIAAYKAGVFTAGTIAPRDANSISENPNWVSTTGSSADFLHINTGIATGIESGAVNIATYTDDYEGNVRQGNPGYPVQVNGGGVAPDIGADEFDGTLLAITKSLTSITYNQASVAAVPQGATNQEILRLDFAVTGNSGTLNLNSIVVNSLNTSNADVTSVKLYRTTSTTFSTSNALGSATNFSGGNATFSSLAYDLPTGTTYIWVAYDVSASATLNNLLDAQIQANQINVAATTYPATDQSPAGTRTILNQSVTGTGTATFAAPIDRYYNYNTWECIYLQSELGTSKDITKIAFNKSSGADVNPITPVTVYMKHTTATILTTGKYDLTGYSQVFTGTFPNTATSGWMEMVSSTSFAYNGTDNLQILIVKGNQAYTSHTYYFATTMATNRARQGYSDTEQPGITGGTVDLTASTNVPNLRFDYTLPTPKALGTIVYNQASTANVNINTNNNPILRIDLPVTGSSGTLNLNSFIVTSLNTSDADIAASGVKLYRTSSTTFSAANLLGSAQSFSGGTATFSSLSYDLPTGTTYVWVTYDIAAGATLGNTADAKLMANAINVAGVTYPASEESPSGSRTIADDKMLSSITVTQASTATAIKGSLNNETLLLDFNVTGSTGSLPLNSIVVTYTGTASADIATSGVKLFRTATNVFGTTNQLGSAVSLSSSLATFSILAYDLPTGHTYVWVTFDVASAATNNNKVDAKIAANGINVNGSTYNSVEDNPAGNRNIFYTTYTLPFVEVFTGSSMPANWSTSGTPFSVSTSHGKDGTAGMYYNIYSSGTTCNSITPFMGAITATSQLYFDYRIIDYTGYPATATTLALLGIGTIKAEVSTDGTTFTPVLTIDNTNHVVSTSFATKSVSLSSYVGQNVYIRFIATWGTGSGGDYYVDIDNVNVYTPANMAYSSSTTTQSVVTSVNAGTTSQQVIGVQVVTTGNLLPIDITKLTINANGTTSVSDISNAKIWYTGTSSTFATTSQFGSVAASPTIANFDVTGTQTLAQGTNYFWVTYDVNSTAVNNNVIDAECATVTVGGSDYTPTITAPSGSRAIVNKTLTSVTGVQASTASVTQGATNQQVLRLDFLVAGPATGSLILNSIDATYTGTSATDIPASGVKLYTTATTTFATTNLLGTAQSLSGGVASFTGLNYSLSTGALYVWVAFDIDAAATLNNTVDAKIVANGINVGGTTYNGSDIDPGGSRTIRGALSGDYLVGSAQTSPNYTTLTQAISDLNSLGISSSVRFLLTDATYSGSETFPININAVTGISASKTVTIKPNTGVTAAISGSTSSAALIKILSNYVTMDGSNADGGSSRDLTITNTSVTSPRVILLGSTGATPITNTTIKNCVLINGIISSSAVLVSDGASIGTAGYFNNITIQNNSVQKASMGIYCIAVVASGNGSGLNISNNTMTATSTNAIRNVGIYVQGVDGATVSNNTIGNFETTTAENDYGIWFATGTVNSSISNNTISTLGFSSTTAYAPVGIIISSGVTGASITVSGNTISGLTSTGTGTTSGIYIYVATSGVIISGNKISNIKNTNGTGYGANGIYLASTSTSAAITVSNNVIFDVAGYGYAGASASDNGYGIIVSAGAGYSIYYNSVNMNTNQTAATGLPAAFNVTSGVATAGAIDLRNNIFVNSQTTGTQRYAIYSGAAATVFTDINYNDYYTTGTNIGFLTSILLDIAAWRIATGKDANSISANPQFTSATNLLPLAGSPVIAVGTPIGTVTTDYNGATRSLVATTMGAYEVIPTTLVWTGATDTDWNKSTNWSPDGVPSTGTAVTISDVTNDPIVNQAPGTPAACADLTINSGLLTIAAGKALT